jgi:hypothetical protein
MAPLNYEPQPTRVHVPAGPGALSREPSAIVVREPPPVVVREPPPVISRREPTVAGREQFTQGVLCHPRRRVIGDERSSQEQARTAAENAWMGSVRYDYGERYQDLNLAKDLQHSCGPSSPSGTLKSTMFRCSTEATPCRSGGR